MTKMKDVDKVFSKFKSGVYVVTTVIDGTKYGWTISWVSKISFKPALVMISIGKNRKEHEKFIESEVFAVNVLGDKHIEIGRHFGLSSGENVNKFDDIDFIELKTGSPILKDSVGAVDCKIIKSVDAGDHIIFVGEVLDAINNDGDGAAFSNNIFP